MRKNTPVVVALFAAASLSLAGTAFAQGHDDDHGHPQGHDNGGHDQRHDERRQAPQQRDMHPPMAQHGGERGAGPDHNFYRGQRLSNDYRGNQYVVDDWRDHHLNAPPRGYHWVQAGGDYVLVAIASGIIANVLLGN